MQERIIHLRRPPVLQVQGEPFVPERASMGEIDERWEALRADNPAYYDGRVYHVLGVHRNGHGGAVLHVTDCAYRFHAVQDASFDLGVRSLGTKGLTWRDDQVLLGLRSSRVGQYRGMWEFAPGGVVEPGETPEGTVMKELQEETGLTAHREPVAIALVFDPVLRCWETVHRITVASSAAETSSAEYDELRWCSPDALPEPMSPVARQVRELLRRP